MNVTTFSRVDHEILQAFPTRRSRQFACFTITLILCLAILLIITNIPSYIPGFNQGPHPVFSVDARPYIFRFDGHGPYYIVQMLDNLDWTTNTYPQFRISVFGDVGNLVKHTGTFLDRSSGFYLTYGGPLALGGFAACETALFKHFLQKKCASEPNTLVVDVGANIGYFSLYRYSFLLILAIIVLIT